MERVNKAKLIDMQYQKMYIKHFFSVGEKSTRIFSTSYVTFFFEL